MEEFCFGTGGLVRAYSNSLIGAIENTEIIQREFGYITKIIVNYQDIEKIKYYLKQNKIRIIDIIFNQNAELIIEIKKENYNNILTKKEDFNFKINGIEIIKEGYIKV